MLAPWKKNMTNLDSILKSRDISLPTKVCIVKAVVFPVVTYGCESWTINKAECQRNDVFELWCWRRLLGVPWTAALQASVSITNSWSLLKLMPIESVMPSNHLILCHPLLLPPSIFPSIRGSSNESVLHIRWPKYWSFSFSISPSNEYSGLISFRISSPCSPRNSQESSPTPQFKSINSSALIFLCGPTHTSIRDYWKNHSFD